MGAPLLRVRHLTAKLCSPPEAVLDDISFDLPAGSALGVLGESGAGKTTLARAIMQLLPLDLWAIHGSVELEGNELLRAKEKQLQKVRGARMTLISQEPELALNPVMRVGDQVDEVLRAHATLNRSRRRDAVLSGLKEVGLPDPGAYRAYPHELSGGQRQRVVIAQCLVSKPALLIADEPTSALDSVTQRDILILLTGLKRKLRLSLLFITHHPALLSGLVDQVLVLSSRRVIETGTFEQIYRKPQHPFTKALLQSVPPMPGPSPHGITADS